ncbi:hypothetical protein SAMN05443572_103457 [Myxococcus fulvus]|uniref:Lipoprotein n=1 Tax=Myxococcus fulvus TaxID=33 RepID=A0A511TEL3_MYXFU|nr:hypothetical protein [Myxococcus fulvus]AKF86183.1 hypothetical protein MFUL124B02_22990 [Myxococcus fulvus 124B02]GEN12610.1 hypothetical protein MFU01_76470 [Myxococcus fulvus]SET84216.1 hypothetical protein SAMN05443572_103457 [Myxococcus fulvus]
MRKLLGVALTTCVLMGCGGVEEPLQEPPPLAEQEQKAEVCIEGFRHVFTYWTCQDGCNVEVQECCSNVVFNLCYDYVSQQSCDPGCT